MLEGGRPAFEGGELMASPSWTLPTGRSVLMEPDTDRSSVEAKTARLAAAKERQRTLRRQATAATIILQLSAHRTCLLCRTLQQWRTALALQAAAAARLPAPSTPRLRLHLAGASAATPAATPRPTAPTERVSSDDELAALRSALATTRRARAQSEARAEVERRLLVRELMAEADVRVDSVEREKQSIVLAHLYEKQELRTSHQRALQKAEFAKLDMLAQQEARTRVREKQLYEHALSQIGQLKAQLSERSEAAERYIELVRAQEEADEERARATPTHGAARAAQVDAHDDAVSGVATPDPFPTCGASAGAAPAAEGADAESESGATDTVLPPRPPPIAAGDSPETAPAATPAATPPATPTAAQPKARAVASAADVGSAAGHGTSRGSTALTPRRLAVAATAEADALRAALAKADAKAEATRAAHADEIGQCDTQAARLREALTMLEQRLRMTEEALKVARQQATEAEAARSRALMETQDSMREAAELRQQLAAPSSRSGTARGTTRPLCTPREATAAAAGAASAEGIRRAHHSAGSAHHSARSAHHSAGSAAGLRSAAHPRSAAGAALSLPRCALPSPTEKGAVAGGSGTATAEAASVAGGAAGVPGLPARLPAGLAEQLRLPLERIGRFEFDASNEGDYAHFENEAASADEIEGDEIEGDEIERGGFSARWGDDAESLRESIGALDEELLLSQRALDFLAELPLTPAAASRASSRASSLPSPSAPGCLSFGAFASGAPFGAPPGTVGNGNASSASSSPEIAARPDTTPLGKRANTKFGKSPPPLPRQKLTVEQKL